MAREPPSRSGTTRWVAASTPLSTETESTRELLRGPQQAGGRPQADLELWPNAVSAALRLGASGGPKTPGVLEPLQILARDEAVSRLEHATALLFRSHRSRMRGLPTGNKRMRGRF